MIDGSKFPKQVKSDEAGDDSRCVWDLKQTQTGRGKGIVGNGFHFNQEIVLRSVFTGVIEVRVHPSYHNIAVIQLEAVEHPGSRSEQGGYSQREGQALHITTTHHFYLKWKKKQQQTL